MFIADREADGREQRRRSSRDVVVARAAQPHERRAQLLELRRRARRGAAPRAAWCRACCGRRAHEARGRGRRAASAMPSHSEAPQDVGDRQHRARRDVGVGRRARSASSRPWRAARSRGCRCRACRGCPTCRSARAVVVVAAEHERPGRWAGCSGVAPRGDEDGVGVLAVGDDRGALLQREAVAAHARRRRCSSARRRRCRPRSWPRRRAAARRRGVAQERVEDAACPAVARRGMATWIWCIAKTIAVERAARPSSRRPRPSSSSDGAAAAELDRHERRAAAPSAAAPRSPRAGSAPRGPRRRRAGRGDLAADAATDARSGVRCCGSTRMVMRSHLGRDRGLDGARCSRTSPCSRRSGNSMSNASSSASMTLTLACEVMPAA